MKTIDLLIIALLLVASDAAATSIFKCKTPGGVTFSEKPCSPEAVKLHYKRSETRESFAAPSGAWLPTVDIAPFEGFGMITTEEIIERVGRPAASYTHRETEHWLYPNAVRQSESGRHCPELLLEDGQKFQTNWLPEDVMRKSVAAAKRFAGWTQPTEIKEKTFDASDTAVVGNRKAGIVRKFGQPDGKRVYNGREIWEYDRVRMAANNPETLTIFLEFDGDVVTSAVGN